MVNIESTSVIVSTVALLLMFIFFAANLGMIVLERKLPTTNIQAFGASLVTTFSKTKNPNSYKQARIYLVSSALSLFAFIALLEFGYA